MDQDVPKSGSAFRERLEEIFTGAVDSDSARLLTHRTADRTDGRCVSRLFRERFEKCAVLSADGRRFGALIFLQLVDGSITVKNSAGSLLESSLRMSDAVWDCGKGRLAVLIAGLRDSSDAPVIAEKVYEILQDPYSSLRGSGTSPTWMGASVFDTYESDSEDCWCQARSALQRALLFSAGTCCFTGLVTGRTMMERFDFIRDAYHAYRNGEFFIVYQPIFGMDGEQVTGFEALLRWQHPRHGLLYPQTFMDSLEESGLIVPIGEWVLNEACQMAGELSRTIQRPLRVCVNVSARQLDDTAFLFSVLDAMYDAGIDAGRLQLECPAQILSRESGGLETMLGDLAKAGVRIAIDHFGAEKISLNALRSLPVTLIKMDRTLTRGLADDAVSRAITSGTLAMANGVGMSVAAVGIEDGNQMRVLDQMGCTEVQGNLLSRPHAAVDLLGWLSA